MAFVYGFRVQKVFRVKVSGGFRGPTARGSEYSLGPGCLGLGSDPWVHSDALECTRVLAEP